MIHALKQGTAARVHVYTHMKSLECSFTVSLNGSAKAINKVMYSHSHTSFWNAKLIQAASDGNVYSVRHALAKGANIYAKNHTGRTALMTADLLGHTDVVNYLTSQE